MCLNAALVPSCGQNIIFNLSKLEWAASFPLHQCVVLVHGARIGYFQGDIRLLMDDLKTLQPTVFPVVPRLLNRMFDKVSLCCLCAFVVRSAVSLVCCFARNTIWIFLIALQVFGQANTPLKRWLLDFAFRRKEAELKNGVVRKDSMWDTLIFKKVQVNTKPFKALGDVTCRLTIFQRARTLKRNKDTKWINTPTHLTFSSKLFC